MATETDSATTFSRLMLHEYSWEWETELTGHVPPDMILSKDRASGMPLLMHELPDAIDSRIEFCFSSPLIESADEDTLDGRL